MAIHNCPSNPCPMCSPSNTHPPTQAGPTALPADLVGDDAWLVERPSEAIEVLGGPYRQLDEDGVIVGVSRQAIYETLAYLTQLEAQLANLQADGDKLAGALDVAESRFQSLGSSCGRRVCIQSRARLGAAAARQALTEWKDRA